MLDQIKEYENVLTQQQFEAVEAYLKTSNWGLHTSDHLAKHKMFWSLMRLEEFELFNTEILNVIEQLTETRFELIRCYANAQTILLDGHEHMDGAEENDFTFLIYMNRIWKYEWGGETMFFDRYYDMKTQSPVQLSSKYKLYLPFPNNGLFFPGRIYHYGRAPGRDFYGVRYSLAFKLLKI